MRCWSGPGWCSAGVALEMLRRCQKVCDGDTRAGAGAGDAAVTVTAAVAAVVAAAATIAGRSPRLTNLPSDLHLLRKVLLQEFHAGAHLG